MASLPVNCIYTYPLQTDPVKVFLTVSVDAKS